MVGISTLKAQVWEDNSYVIGKDGVSLIKFKFPEDDIAHIPCSPIRMEATGATGFYCEKPIFEPKIVGGDIEFNIKKYFTYSCFVPEEWSNWGNIDFKVNDTTKLLLKGSNGRVGINTINPQRQLDVNGDIGAKSLFITHTAAGDWSFASEVRVNRDLTKAFVVSNTKTGGGEVSIIYGNGIVNAKKIYAEEFEMHPNAMNIQWFDHVFAKDYKLRSLSELEQFITTNKHLPEIPSAKEVAENGINLGQMQGKLLLKVEELTLYIKEKKKQIKALQQQINEKGDKK
jgi:hypothetical protein